MKIAIIYHPLRMRATEDKIYGSHRKILYPTLNGSAKHSSAPITKLQPLMAAAT